MSGRPPGKLRITGGALRGRTIAVPSGIAVRPMRSRIRQSLFDMLGDRLHGARVLDLFAGSGAISLEALSRGAREAVLVEQNARVREVLRQNVRALALGARARVLEIDAYTGDLAREGVFDFISLDPPFAQYEEYPPIATGTTPNTTGARIPSPWLLACRVAASAQLRAGGLIALESPAKAAAPPPPEGVRLFAERRYGETALIVWEKA